MDGDLGPLPALCGPRTFSGCSRMTRPEAYRFFARGLNEDRYAGLSWWKRLPLQVRAFFVAFTLRLPPARRVLYIGSLVIALFGLIRLFQGFSPIEVPLGLPFVRVMMLLPVWTDGTFALLVAFLLLNLLVLLEVADRLSLKNDLEVAREIQLAMLPHGTYRRPGLEICGLTRPANTVGGDFYDVLPLDDGRVVVTVGDVAGKGSPAALLMALLLAMLRTLVDEELEPCALVERLNARSAGTAQRRGSSRSSTPSTPPPPASWCT
jgi:phosphoserine phosphatase RsbU/P